MLHLDIAAHVPFARLRRQVRHRHHEVLAVLRPLVRVVHALLDGARRRTWLGEVVLEFEGICRVVHAAHGPKLLLNVPGVVFLGDVELERALDPFRRA